jgi:uncharacterized protein YqeY
MGLEEKLLEDMKSAMKSGDKLALEAIRMLRAQVKNACLAKREELSDEDIVDVLIKESKRQKESLDMFKKGGREDLVEKVTRELEITSQYLPDPLSHKEVEKIINQVIEETGAVSIKEMGKVMGIVMSQLKGRTEGKLVQDLVRQKLG